MPRSASDERGATEMQSSGSRDGETMGHPTKTRIIHTKGASKVRMEDWFRRTRGTGSVTPGISTRLSRSRARVTAEEHHQCSLRPKYILPDAPRTSGQKSCQLCQCLTVKPPCSRNPCEELGPTFTNLNEAVATTFGLFDPHAVNTSLHGRNSEQRTCYLLAPATRRLDDTSCRPRYHERLAGTILGRAPRTRCARAGAQAVPRCLYDATASLPPVPLAAF